MAVPRFLALAGALLPALCLAVDVQLVGVTPGRSADLVIEGGPPVTVDVGETYEGVKLLNADGDSAVVSVGGARKTLSLRAYQAPVDAAGSTVTLRADGSGHFVASATVNGRAVRFVVDTGATLTTLSRGDAERIGLNYRDGTRVRAATANGIAEGWRTSLHSIRIGGVTVYDVDAVVMDNDALPIGLLGMSFLDRFDMQRRGETLVLRRRR